jgi:hypothetical protein
MSARGRRRRHGQAMVEFALIAPIFFLILFAIMEAGRFVFYYEMLSNAAREGARYAIVHGANSSCPTGPMTGTNPCGADATGERVKQAVRDAAISLADTGQLFPLDPIWTPQGVECGTGSGTNVRGACVTVPVQYSYSPLIPILPTITVSAESSLVINN